MKWICFILLIFGYRVHSQSACKCSNLKKSVTFVYPEGTNEAYKIVRKSAKQVEYDLKSGDSAIFRIKWVSCCAYRLKFIHTSEKTSQDNLRLLRERRLQFYVESVTEGFYVYKSYLLDRRRLKPGSNYITKDTAWFQPRH